ncbi:MAG: lipid-A-disaccharide synthase [Verrucomicrobiota bacterium]|nr:lipid-A-disaccharide synthase [Verrucomicrobiota bacterium]
MSKRLYFVAGEASGDAHGAALMSALRESDPALEFLGRGGLRMRDIAGAAFTDWSESSSVLGLWEVLKHYRYFRGELRATIAHIKAQAPDAVILIDYPGFNLRLARALRAALPRLKIIYYISPQVWAWNRRRIPQMARYLDLMLCIFPFEAELYNTSGLRTVFVGHPMLETLAQRRTTALPNPNLVGLFPGSRMREIAKILPIMFSAARELIARRPATRFEIAAATPALAEEIRRMLPSSELRDDVVRVTTGDASATMQRAQAGIVASGTATLEAAYFRLPFVLVYRVALPTYLAARLVVKVKHLGMPNVLAGREIVPEFIQHHADPQKIADAVARLMNDAEVRNLMVAEFDIVVASLGEAGASQSAAAAVIEEIERN